MITIQYIQSAQGRHTSRLLEDVKGPEAQEKLQKILRRSSNREISLKRYPADVSYLFFKRSLSASTTHTTIIAGPEIDMQPLMAIVLDHLLSSPSHKNKFGFTKPTVVMDAVPPASEPVARQYTKSPPRLSARLLSSIAQKILKSPSYIVK